MVLIQLRTAAMEWRNLSTCPPMKVYGYRQSGPFIGCRTLGNWLTKWKSWFNGKATTIAREIWNL
jgi:hypothetical protein